MMADYDGHVRRRLSRHARLQRAVAAAADRNPGGLVEDQGAGLPGTHRADGLGAGRRRIALKMPR